MPLRQKERSIRRLALHNSNWIFLCRSIDVYAVQWPVGMNYVTFSMHILSVKKCAQGRNLTQSSNRKWTQPHNLPSHRKAGFNNWQWIGSAWSKYFSLISSGFPCQSMFWQFSVLAIILIVTGWFNRPIWGCSTYRISFNPIIMWHIYPLLGNESGISSYKIAIAR
jgi:hypothetical protein